MERYTELTDEIKQHYISCRQITKDILPIYIEVLYIPNFEFNDFENNNPVNIKHILLSGYIWSYCYNIYVEYLNLDGYLETRIYNEYNLPNIYERKI